MDAWRSRKDKLCVCVCVCVFECPTTCCCCCLFMVRRKNKGKRLDVCHLPMSDRSNVHHPPQNNYKQNKTNQDTLLFVQLATDYLEAIIRYGENKWLVGKYKTKKKHCGSPLREKKSESHSSLACCCWKQIEFTRKQKHQERKKVLAQIYIEREGVIQGIIRKVSKWKKKDLTTL